MGMTPSDEQAFDTFVRQRGDQLLRYAHLLTADRGEAEDVLQEALLRVARQWSKPLEAPEAYVRVAILNAVRDGARRRHLVPVPSEPSAEPDTRNGGDLSDALAARSRLEALLGALPPRQRATVVLRVIEGWTEAETAAALDCSVGTVKSNLARGLDKVRATMLADAGRKETTLR
jgi:RNA polymerase sigma-70 factor (sigma-E family)